MRRDTAARWAQYNPILMEGEVGFVTDDNSYKIGDGENHWNDLPLRGSSNEILRINVYIEETAATDLGITYQNLLSSVQNGDIKALQDPNGSLYGVIVSDGTLYAYCQFTNIDGAYLLAGVSYILTDAGSGNIKIERDGETKLPYLDGNNKIPELMLPDNINITVYDFNSIDTLTESSTADEIKEALTPKGETSMRVPNSGDIMEIGIEENPDTVSVLYRYRNTFAYYHNRLLTTIEVEGEDDSLSVVKTISRNYVYDFDKINALTNASTFSDILHAFSPLIMGSYTLLPKTGDLLTSGYDEAGDAARSAKVICHNGNSFAYCYGGKHVTVELVGKLGNPDMRVEKTVTDLAETGYEPKKYDYDKVMALSNESTELDVNEAFTPIGGGTMEWPMPGDLLVSTDDRNHVIILGKQQTTASNAAITIRYIYSNVFLRNISIRHNPRFSISVADIDFDKEVETNGALRITTSNIANITTGGTASCDLGVTFQQLQEAITNNQLIMGNTNGELYAAVDGNSNVTLMSVAYLSNNWYSIVMNIPSYTVTTATVTVTAKLLTKFVVVPYSFLSGEIGGTYESVKMPDLLAANIIQTDKGIATLDTTSGYVLSLLVDGKDYVRCTIDYSDNGGLKLTARTETPIVPKLELDFSSAFDSTDNFIANTEIEGLDKLEEFSNTYGPGNILVKGIPTFRTPAVFCGFDLSTKMREFAVLALHSDTTGNTNADEKTVIRSVHSTIYVFGLKTVDGKTVLGTLTKRFYPMISSAGGETKIYADDISPIVREIAGVYSSSTEINSASEFSGDQQGTNYLVYSEGTYQLYVKFATVVLPSSSTYKNILYKITRTGTVTDYPEGTVMYEYEGNVLVPAPKASYNKIAHLVFDLEVIGEKDVTLTLDRLNSYWLESIGSSANLNLRYEGGVAHGMPMLDIVYSKIDTDVNNDEALWQKAFTDNNIVFTNCDIPSDQKIITTVDLSAGKVATLTIDFSNVTSMTPFKEDNPKIFVEIYEPVK